MAEQGKISKPSKPEDTVRVEMPADMPDLWYDPKAFEDDEELNKFLLEEYRRWREESAASDDLRDEQKKAVDKLRDVTRRDGQPPDVPEIKSSTFLEQLESNFQFDQTALGRGPATRFRQAFQADPDRGQEPFSTTEFDYGSPLNPLAHYRRFRSFQGTDGSVALQQKQFERINPDNPTDIIIDPVTGEPILTAYDPRTERWHPVDFGAQNLFDITDWFSGMATWRELGLLAGEGAAAYAAPQMFGGRMAGRAAEAIQKLSKITGGPTNPKVAEKLWEISGRSARGVTSAAGAAAGAGLGQQADEFHRHMAGMREYDFDEAWNLSKAAAEGSFIGDIITRPIIATAMWRFDKTRMLTVPDVESTLDALTVARQLNLPPIVWSDLTPLGKMRIVQAYQRTITGRKFTEDRVAQIFNRLHNTFTSLGNPETLTPDTIQKTVDLYRRELKKEFKLDKTFLSSSGQNIQEGFMALDYLMKAKFENDYLPFNDILHGATWDVSSARNMAKNLLRPHRQKVDPSLNLEREFIDTRGDLYSRPDLKRFLQDLSVMDSTVASDRTVSGLQKMRDLRTRARHLMEDDTFDSTVQGEITKVHNELSKIINNPSTGVSQWDKEAFRAVNSEYNDYIKLAQDIELHRKATALKPEELGSTLSPKNLTQVKRIKKAYMMMGEAEGKEAFEKLQNGWKTDFLAWSPSKVEKVFLSENPADQEFLRLMVPNKKERDNMLGYARATRRFNTSTVMRMSRKDLDDFTGIADFVQQGRASDIQKVLMANKGAAEDIRDSDMAHSLRSGLFIYILGASSMASGSKNIILPNRAVSMFNKLEDKGIFDVLFWRNADGDVQLNKPGKGVEPVLLKNLRAYLDILAPIGQAGASIGSAALAEETKAGNIVAEPGRFLHGKKRQITNYITAQILITDVAGRLIRLTNRHGEPGGLITETARKPLDMPEIYTDTYMRALIASLTSLNSVQNAEERRQLSPHEVANKHEIDMDAETQPENYIPIAYVDPSGLNPNQMFMPSFGGDMGNRPPQMQLNESLRKLGVSNPPPTRR